MQTIERQEQAAGSSKKALSDNYTVSGIPIVRV